MSEIEREVSAGGVVYRLTPTGREFAIAERTDWHNGQKACCLPKGLVDPGETLEEAALREVEEEIGIQAEIEIPLEPIHYHYHHSVKKIRIEKNVHFFLMAYQRGELRPADGEMDSVHWIPAEQALEKLTYESERNTVAQAITLLKKKAP